MATNARAGEPELMGFLKGVYVYEPKGVKKPWAQFWMKLSGRGFFGRMATRLAEWGVAPYQGKFYLSRLCWMKLNWTLSTFAPGPTRTRR